MQEAAAAREGAAALPGRSAQAPGAGAGPGAGRSQWGHETTRPPASALRDRGFSTREAAGAGLSPERLRRSDLRRPVGLGVQVPAGCETPITEAARALTGRHPGTVVSHRTAAALLDLRRPARWAEDGTLHVTRGDGARSLRRPGVSCRRSAVAPEETTVVDGVPVTNPLRTFLDLCAELSPVDAVVMADGLLCAHRHGPRAGIPAVCTREELDSALRARAGARGVARARAAAARARTGSDSGPETWLRLILEDHGVGGMVLDHALLDEHGRLQVLPDIALPEHRLSLQYEGAHHDLGGQRLRDVARQRRTEALGWRELRVCWSDLVEWVAAPGGPAPRVVVLVRGALGA